MLDETDPFLNMAVEEAVLKSVNSGSSPSTLRLWNNSTSLILGIAGDVEKEVNLDVCTRLKVPLVRRFTGGGAVYNDPGNLNWSFFVSDFHHQVLEEGISKIYGRLSTPIVRALSSLGVQATFRAPNGLFHGHLKLSGMAMYVKQSAILCHGTLLVEADLERLRLLLRRLKDPVENINNLPGVRLNMGQVRQAISEEIRNGGQALLVTDNLDPLEKNLVIHSSLDQYKVKLGQPKGHGLTF